MASGAPPHRQGFSTPVDNSPMDLAVIGGGLQPFGGLGSATHYVG
jgi:hypothetical protein